MSEVNIYNIHIHQGENWTMTLTLKDENGAARNLTGYTGKMQIRDKPGGTVYEELATAPGSGMVIDAIYGEINLSLSMTETAALKIRNAVYDLFIYNTTGATSTPLLKGNVIVEARVTV